MSLNCTSFSINRARKHAGAACLAVAVGVFGLGVPPASAGTVTCGGEAPTMTGTTSDDVVTGTDGPDVIATLGGHDVVTALGGDDLICGGRGVDDIDAGAGDDYVWGGGDGKFHHREGDWVEGGPGDDHLSGGNDPSETGGIENHEDIVVYAEAARGIDINLSEPTVTGQGVDTIDGFFSVVGSKHADVIVAAAETDVVRGLPGSDHITVDSDEGEVFGGDGNDVLVHGFAVYGGNGDDEIRGALKYANGAAGRDLMIGTQKPDNYRGGLGADAFRGRDGKDFLDGTQGEDHVDGGPGDDWLRGGKDADRLDGDSGDDQLEPDVANNRADDVVSGGPGSDAVSYLNAYVPRGVHVDLSTAVANGAGRDVLHHVENATGTELADTLLGDAGRNVLNGGEGDDVLTGRDGRDTILPDNTDNDFAPLGDDTIRGGRSIDRVSYALASGGGGVVADLRSGTASGRGEDALDSIEQLRGTYATDSLLGDQVNNVLYGGGGNDTLRGRGGDDLTVGGSGSDTCTAEATRSCAVV